MMTITIDPVVLEKLHASFPNPKTSAAKALKKYKDLLEAMLFKAMQRGRSSFESKFNLFSIPVSQLTHKGPQIGYFKVRLHKWLEDNDLRLVEVVERGSNLTGKVSLVKLSELVSIEDNTEAISQILLDVTTAKELDSALCSDANENASIFAALYPDYFAIISPQQHAQTFDLAPIDIGSLEAYIAWLNTKANLIAPGRKRVTTEQALLILAVAKHTGGYFPQRCKPSPFGRMYYSGISVQNVNKDLRRAMLGNCWEYDIRSSVIAWKMTFAQELTDQLYPTKECSKLFWSSIWYLQKRNEFMLDVRTSTFGPRYEFPIEFQDGLIKQAITAISFGARANVLGWRAGNGSWANPAIVDILTNEQQRAGFLANYTVQCFIKEQNLLDSYLANGLKDELPDVYFGPLITRNVKPSKSKAVAYLYQRSETIVMDIARSVLAKHEITPIACIHDAFVVRHRLALRVRDEVIYEMKSQTRNSYWAIKGTRLQGFRFSN